VPESVMAGIVTFLASPGYKHANDNPNNGNGVFG
jgi:hypothetical protein